MNAKPVRFEAFLLAAAILASNPLSAADRGRGTAFRALYGDKQARKTFTARKSSTAQQVPPLFQSSDRKVKKNVRELQKLGFLHEDICRETVNHVNVLVDNVEIFPRAFEMMRRAKKEIIFHMYLFGGTAASQTIDILKERMEAGVKVRILFPNPKQGLINRIGRIGKTMAKILPGAGSDKEYVEPPYLPKFEKAVAAGLPVVYSDLRKIGGGSFVKIDHEKILVIDREEAMVGGMNFADTVASNHDAMIHVVGPLVKSLVQNFQVCWALSGGPEPEQFNMGDYRIPKRLKGVVGATGYHEVRITPTYTAPHLKNTKEILLSDIRACRKTLWIEMLLLTDEDCIEEVLAAFRRGVDVKILLDPNESLYGLNCKGAPNVKLVELCRDLGLPVKHYHCKPGQELHMKLCIIDDQLTWLGSTNWTRGAFVSAYESFFRAEGASFNEHFRGIFQTDWTERGNEPPVLTPLQRKIFTKLSDYVEELF